MAALLAVAGIAAGFSLPAQAGFEWTPPPVQARPAAAAAPLINAAPLQPGPAVRAAPVEAVDATMMPPSDPLLPEGRTAGAMPRGPQDGLIASWPVAASQHHHNNNPDAIDMSIASEPLAPPPPAISWRAAPPVPEAAPSLPAGHYETIEGFGSDIPLAIALQQIVPAQYAYSFGPGVDPGRAVSWNGGQPWNRVLETALAPAGLQASLAGKAIVIQKTGMSASASWAAQDADAPWSPPPVAEASAGPLRLEQDSAAPLPYRAIGMDDSGYQPSYPRRTPSRGLQGDGPQTVNSNPSLFRDLFRKSEPASQDGASADPAAARSANIQPAAGPESAPVSLLPGDEQGGILLMSTSDLIPAEAPAPRGPAALDPTEIRYWNAPQGADLKAVLSQWAGDSGVKLLWQAGESYALPEAIQMHGTFADAVTEALGAYENERARPTGQLYPHLPDGNAALVING